MTRKVVCDILVKFKKTGYETIWVWYLFCKNNTGIHSPPDTHKCTSHRAVVLPVCLAASPTILRLPQAQCPRSLPSPSSYTSFRCWLKHHFPKIGARSLFYILRVTIGEKDIFCIAWWGSLLLLIKCKVFRSLETRKYNSLTNCNINKLFIRILLCFQTLQTLCTSASPPSRDKIGSGIPCLHGVKCGHMTCFGPWNGSRNMYQFPVKAFKKQSSLL